MWFFSKKSKLPGVEQHPDGQVSFTLTDEEQAEVDGFFRTMRESSEETEWALISYAQSQVVLAEMADKGAAEKDLCFRKALSAASKSVFSPLPTNLYVRHGMHVRDARGQCCG